MGGVERLVDVLGAGAGEFGDGFAVDRRGVGEIAAKYRWLLKETSAPSVPGCA
jgi:hypothetical protein